MFFRKKISYDSQSDEDLMRQYRKDSNSELIGILFNRYSHLVFGICLKYLKNQEESKDAVMQLFEKLPEDLIRYEISNFKSWLFMVSKNHCLMLLRKSRNEMSLDDSLYSERFLVESDEEIHLYKENEQQLIALEQTIDLLNSEQRLCIELFYLKEKSYKEICDETGYTLLQVKSFLQNGKRNLKNLMLEKYGSGK